MAIFCHMLISADQPSRKHRNLISCRNLETFVKMRPQISLPSSHSTPTNWKIIDVKGHRDAAKHARKIVVALHHTKGKSNAVKCPSFDERSFKCLHLSETSECNLVWTIACDQGAMRSNKNTRPAFVDKARHILSLRFVFRRGWTMVIRMKDIKRSAKGQRYKNFFFCLRFVADANARTFRGSNSLFTIEIYGFRRLTIY